jgi:hypothetical protein
MADLFVVYGRKLLGFILVFNSLLTIFYAVGFLIGLYTAHWIIYQPYLINAALLWAIIPVAIMNLYPSIKIGHVPVIRLWFHHYIYGFLVLASSVLFILTFTSVSIVNLFMAHINNLSINFGRLLILVGLTMVVDDFGDISNSTNAILAFLKVKASQRPQVINWLHCLLGGVCLYIFVAIIIWLTQNPHEVTSGNLLFAGSLIVTIMTTFVTIAEKTWLKLSPENLEH